MKVLITGTSQGIGKAIAELFLQKGHCVIGIDRKEASLAHECYTHIQADVRDELPEIDEVEILVNNAGTQNEADIDINLKAYPLYAELSSCFLKLLNFLNKLCFVLDKLIAKLLCLFVLFLYCLTIHASSFQHHTKVPYAQPKQTHHLSSHFFHDAGSL